MALSLSSAMTIAHAKCRAKDTLLWLQQEHGSDDAAGRPCESGLTGSMADTLDFEWLEATTHAADHAAPVPSSGPLGAIAARIVRFQQRLEAWGPSFPSFAVNVPALPHQEKRTKTPPKSNTTIEELAETAKALRFVERRRPPRRSPGQPDDSERARPPERSIIHSTTTVRAGTPKPIAFEVIEPRKVNTVNVVDQGTCPSPSRFGTELQESIVRVDAAVGGSTDVAMPSVTATQTLTSHSAPVRSVGVATEVPVAVTRSHLPESRLHPPTHATVGRQDEPSAIPSHASTPGTRTANPRNEVASSAQPAGKSSRLQPCGRRSDEPHASLNDTPTNAQKSNELLTHANLVNRLSDALSEAITRSRETLREASRPDVQPADHRRGVLDRRAAVSESHTRPSIGLQTIDRTATAQSQHRMPLRTRTKATAASGVAADQPEVAVPTTRPTRVDAVLHDRVVHFGEQTAALLQPSPARMTAPAALLPHDTLCIVNEDGERLPGRSAAAADDEKPRRVAPTCVEMNAAWLRLTANGGHPSEITNSSGAMAVAADVVVHHVVATLVHDSVTNMIRQWLRRPVTFDGTAAVDVVTATDIDQAYLSAMWSTALDAIVSHVGATTPRATSGALVTQKETAEPSPAADRGRPSSPASGQQLPPSVETPTLRDASRGQPINIAQAESVDHPSEVEQMLAALLSCRSVPPSDGRALAATSSVSVQAAGSQTSSATHHPTDAATLIMQEEDPRHPELLLTLHARDDNDEEATRRPSVDEAFLRPGNRTGDSVPTRPCFPLLREDGRHPDVEMSLPVPLGEAKRRSSDDILLTAASREAGEGVAGSCPASSTRQSVAVQVVQIPAADSSEPLVAAARRNEQRPGGSTRPSPPAPAVTAPFAPLPMLPAPLLYAAPVREALREAMRVQPAREEDVSSSSFVGPTYTAVNRWVETSSTLVTHRASHHTKPKNSREASLDATSNTDVAQSSDCSSVSSTSVSQTSPDDDLRDEERYRRFVQGPHSQLLARRILQRLTRVDAPRGTTSSGSTTPPSQATTTETRRDPPTSTTLVGSSQVVTTETSTVDGPLRIVARPTGRGMADSTDDSWTDQATSSTTE